MLADLARCVNDRLSDDRRHRIAHLIPRVIGTATDDRAVAVGLAEWLAGRARAAARASDHRPQTAEYVEDAARRAAAADSCAAAEIAAFSAVWGALDLSRSDDACVALLEGAFNEYDRLTSRATPPDLDEPTAARLRDLTSA